MSSTPYRLIHELREVASLINGTEEYALTNGKLLRLAADELEQAQDKLAEYGDEIARLRGEIADIAEHAERLLRIATEFKDFHDDHKNKPCGDYDRECPISMGEWFDAADRQAITMAIKALKNDH